MAAFRQDPTQELAHDLLVIDNDNLCHYAFRVRWRGSRDAVTLIRSYISCAGEKISG
jgi:hypothetical protein